MRVCAREREQSDSAKQNIDTIIACGVHIKINTIENAHTKYAGWSRYTHFIIMWFGAPMQVALVVGIYLSFRVFAPLSVSHSVLLLPVARRARSVSFSWPLYILYSTSICRILAIAFPIVRFAKIQCEKLLTFHKEFDCVHFESKYKLHTLCNYCERPTDVDDVDDTTMQICSRLVCIFASRK